MAKIKFIIADVSPGLIPNPVSITRTVWINGPSYSTSVGSWFLSSSPFLFTPLQPLLRMRYFMIPFVSVFVSLILSLYLSLSFSIYLVTSSSFLFASSLLSPSFILSPLFPRPLVFLCHPRHLSLSYFPLLHLACFPCPFSFIAFLPYVLSSFLSQVSLNPVLSSPLSFISSYLHLSPLFLSSPPHHLSLVLHFSIKPKCS